MKIFDSHLHLDNNFKNPNQALIFLNEKIKKQNVKKYILIHMESEEWNMAEFSKACSKYNNIKKIIKINPTKKNFDKKFLQSIKKYNFEGLKLHPRLHNFSLKSDNVIRLIKIASKNKLPIIIDAFPDGNSLMQKIIPLDYAYLAKKFKDTKFIWAHMGGHQVIEFLLLAKRLKNVILDFSYTLLYYQDSSIEKNILFSFKSMKYDRIVFGSDYPDRTIEKTYSLINNILKKNKIAKDNLEKIMYTNANKLF